MCILVLLISTSVIIVTSSIVVFIISSACKHCSPNSECLKGSSDVSVPGANVCPFVTTCPGFGFYGPANTFYAHARYLVINMGISMGINIGISMGINMGINMGISMGINMGISMGINSKRFAQSAGPDVQICGAV